MKKYIPLLTYFCIVLFLIACNNRKNQLIGKWQKSDNPNVTIEFKADGIYELLIKDEILPSFKYKYSPDLKENNLQIGEDSLKLIGTVEFIQNDKIRIKTLKPNDTIEYLRIN